MNVNLGGIMKKLENNAHWISFLASGYMRFNGDIDALINQYLSGGVISELTRTLEYGPTFIKWKLFDTPHAYSGLFKASLYAWLAEEFGIVPSKYKGTIEKVMLGSGLAALTLPGSSPPGGFQGSSPSGPNIY